MELICNLFAWSGAFMTSIMNHLARGFMTLRSRAKRSSVFMDANLETGDPRYEIQLVRIRDISEGGAKIEATPPAIGASIVISRGAFILPGRVVWASDTHFGVEFERPIDVNKVMQAAGPAKAPGRPIHAVALTSGFVPHGHAVSHVRMPHAKEKSPFGLKGLVHGR